jgi:hypothetical protein
VLRGAVTFGFKIEMDSRGRAWWDGDRLYPFKAIATLGNLVRNGLMEIVPGSHGWSEYRATKRAQDYLCRYRGCWRGRIYADDQETGKCPACAGTGIVLERATTGDRSDG